MKIYIATMIERAVDHNVVRDVLVRAGHRITYDWTLHGSVRNEGVERITQVANAELQGVKDADVVIALLPGGRGTHAEIGAALALDKPVILHATQRNAAFFDLGEGTSAFYWHRGVYWRCATPLIKFAGLLNDTLRELADG